MPALLKKPTKAIDWRFTDACPLPLDEREQLKMGPPPGQTTDCALVSWVKTSTVHAYPVVHFRGSWDACESRRVQNNFPQFLSTYQAEAMPSRN
jgi:hypothetical protein